MSEIPAPKSPCVKVCFISPDSGLCLGCYRTLEEIAQWSSLTADEQAAVWAAIPAREAASTAEKPRPD
ncbi:MAG: DUF1289 domain-containing protein [Maricaulaceae bacterium]